MRRRRISKSLESAARSIKDSDEFVAHLGNVAERYRRERALDAGLSDGALRQALKNFRSRSQSLAKWLESACATRRPGIEAEALGAMASALGRAPIQLQASGKEMLEWLSQAQQAAELSLSVAKSRSRTPQRNAPRIAAEGLRAVFEHHRLKVSAAGSKERPSAIVGLLCAIAKSAGDALTPAEARHVIVASGKTARPEVSRPMTKQPPNYA